MINLSKSKQGHKELLGWLAVFVCVGVLYIATMAPDLVWQDQGDFQYQSAKLSLNRPGDVVRVHPLFIVTSHYLGATGIYSYAYAANFVSALFTVITVSNVYLLVYRLTLRSLPALLSAFILALSHSAWFLGVQAQTYSMANAALTGGMLLVFAYITNQKVRNLYFMGFIFGLGISAHMMSQVGFFVIMCWLFIKVLRRRFSFLSFSIIILFWCIGAFLLWIVMAIEYNRTGDLIATIQSAIWGKWGRAAFNLSRIPVLIKKSVMFFVLNFPTPLVLLSIPGIYLSFKKLKHRTISWLLLICTFMYCLFATRYDVHNQNNFFLPMYILVCIYIGLGFSFIFTRPAKLPVVISCVLLLAIVPTYAGISYLAGIKEIDLGTKRHIPYRDVYNYYLLPWQHNQTGPKQFAAEVFQKVPADSIIFADSTTIPALKYMHTIEGQRPDLEIFMLSEVLDEKELLKQVVRLFTISDVKSYYPYWVADRSWLKPFPISENEHIFEIVVPVEDQILK